MAGLVFLLGFWVLAGACQRHGVGRFLLCNSSSSSSVAWWPAARRYHDREERAIKKMEREREKGREEKWREFRFPFGVVFYGCRLPFAACAKIE